MGVRIIVGLVGDESDAVVAHRAIPVALRLAAERVGCSVEHRWVPTETIDSDAVVQPFDGLWCVPGSPYRSTAGALTAIRHARTGTTPFIGTCGGFQHTVLEYARNVQGWADAEHAEVAGDADLAVISPLACGILEGENTVRFVRGSRLAAAYGVEEAREEYLCGYAINPDFVARLLDGPLRATATDVDGQVRAVELDRHPFFVATLFQPERLALKGQVPPLAVAFLEACNVRSQRTT